MKTFIIIVVVLVVLVLLYDLYKKIREKKAVKAMSKSLISTDDANSLQRYFNGYSDLSTMLCMQGLYLEPLRKENFEKEVNSLLTLAYDKSTQMFMEGFYGAEAPYNAHGYLHNTYMTTKMGIAFGFEIKKGILDYSANTDHDPICGFIKYTSPAFNKVTHNFDGWLVDFATYPKYRNKGIMKLALRTSLEAVEDMDDASKIFAMVDPNNVPSIHVLTKTGFKKTNLPGGINRMTGKPSLIYVYEF